MSILYRYSTVIICSADCVVAELHLVLYTELVLCCYIYAQLFAKSIDLVM